MNAQSLKKIFPVGLLAEGRPCLVAGGGKVALRKVENLLEAGAAVQVISPVINDEIEKLVESGLVKYTARNFQDDDVENMFLVFAATDDKAVNRQILESCRKHSVICCAVDGAWKDADFITPATLRRDNITVSIATGGQSCRQSRLIKGNLSRHLAAVEKAELVVIGTSHEELTLERREPLHLLEDRMKQTGEMLMQVWGIHEFIMLNTCNRIELIAVTSPQTGIDELLKRIMGFSSLAPDDFYIRRGFLAFEHVSVLLAGLRSQTPGENHIVAQVKDALSKALEAGWANSMMKEWIDSSLHVSKDIRLKTSPLLKNFEIEDLCMNYLRSEFPDISKLSILILGAGTIGTAIAKRVYSAGGSCMWCYHINKPQISEAMKDRISVLTFNDIRDCLPEADIIICAATTTGHVLHQGHAPFFNQEKNVKVVDLAIPRNVAPEMDGLISNISVTDLDDLKHWFRRELADMAHILELSRQITEEHKTMYEKIIRQFQGGNKSE